MQHKIEKNSKNDKKGGGEMEWGEREREGDLFWGTDYTIVEVGSSKIFSLGQQAKGPGKS